MPRNEVIKHCDGEKHCSVVADPESGETICVGCGAVITSEMVQTYPSWGVNHQDVQGVIGDRENVSFSLSLP
ncbi:MAG: hypothetical protein WBX81_09015, partial [Nitrososphaeraceae archaeon]